MKKIKLIITSLVVGSMITLLFSCEESFEKKVDNLVTSTIKTTLYYPDSYDPITTEIDSAFTPLGDPKLINKMLEVHGLIEKLNVHIEEMNDAKSEVALWIDSYSPYAVTQYQEAVNRFNIAHKKGQKIAEEIMKIGEEVTEMEQKGSEFIGYLIDHRYRAQNNADNVLIDNVFLIINKDATEVLAAYTSEDFEKISEVGEYLKEYENEL